MEKKDLLLRSAMFYGLLLGIFWTLKYLFFIGGVAYPVMSVVYWILTPLTLLFAYLSTKLYRILTGGRIGFFHAWQFGILLYFCAALIVSPAHYVFYRYLAPPDYIANILEAAKLMIEELHLQSEEAFSQLPVLTPIRLTLQEILTNVFYGVILSTPVAALLCRKRRIGITYLGNPDNPDNHEQKQ